MSVEKCCQYLCSGIRKVTDVFLWKTNPLKGPRLVGDTFVYHPPYLSSPPPTAIPMYEPCSRPATLGQSYRRVCSSKIAPLNRPFIALAHTHLVSPYIILSFPHLPSQHASTPVSFREYELYCTHKRILPSRSPSGVLLTQHFAEVYIY